ncbi:hypothetical protein ACWEFJ_28345 [Actinosynnema sp. NPDC004786]
MADQTNGPASPSSDTEALIENVLNDLADREHTALCNCDLYPNRCRMAGNYTRKRLLATPGYVRTREALAAALDTRSGTIADDTQLPPRLFRLHRDQDVSGVSGTGYVADGVLWPDGSATVHWRGEWRTDASHPAGMPSVRAVHGHGGATRIVWADAAPTATPDPHEVDVTVHDADDAQAWCNTCGRHQVGTPTEVNAWATVHLGRRRQVPASDEEGR